MEEEYNFKGRWGRSKECWKYRGHFPELSNARHLIRCWKSFWDTPRSSRRVKS